MAPPELQSSSLKETFGFDTILRARIKDGLNTPQRHFVAFTAIEVAVSLNDGRVLSFLFAPASVVIDSPQRVGGLLAVAALVIGTAVAVSIRQSLRPLRK